MLEHRTDLSCAALTTETLVPAALAGTSDLFVWSICTMKPKGTRNNTL
jgi:hypothetical protein